MIRDRSSAEASVWLLVLALVPMATTGCGAPSGPEPADMVPVHGKDVTVLSLDIMTIPADEIRRTEVVYTIVGSEVRHERDGGGG